MTNLTMAKTGLGCVSDSAQMLMPVVWETDHVVLIDQTVLPETYTTVPIQTAPAMVDAIATMIVRGAPAIGIAGAFGVVLASQASLDEPLDTYKARVSMACRDLKVARPTAVNLMWAVAQQEAILDETGDVQQCHQALLENALHILNDDIERCKAIGRHGQPLVPKKGAGILTHCNAGALATGGYGTALGVIRKAFEVDPTIQVYADETRPRLQGATLTAWELAYDGIPVTLLADTMAAWAMKQGKIDMVVVGADRIAANGDAANKIGTYQVALAAKAHGIPFYVAAPLSTIDFDCPDGDAIPIEERDGDEIAVVKGQRITPEKGVNFYNPAFDVTPAELITGIITECGVAYPPFATALSVWK